ncbi:hypothetical protein SAMN02910298_01087 [Pseudobutyrivibrio sp. YE44]|uniref:hypothetical protein n=1 Tax=Pseudobutyrivibrio sp. YE44 TaxID=1520802 RepID=UPI00088D2141|nr:hypothetical protein [Pseudobutyrivibrio sp. YE44]SDB22493.1 hypothetical protein SAMN02910298_01087 [Pseudobutyrivibrio sp. YE44]
MDIVKRNVKDSLFTHMFGDDSKEYLLQLYQALHPEDSKAAVEDLDLISIENVLTNDIYNDLGFTVNDRLVILVEAQSTWSENILIRLLMYLGKTYQNYIYARSELKARLYSEAKIKIPKAELYVIYAGPQGHKPSVLSFKDEFLGEEGKVDLIANVIYADEELKQAYGDYRESIGEERGKQQGLQLGLQKGADNERPCNIRSVMESFGISAEEAMSILKIPENQFARYMELLK